MIDQYNNLSVDCAILGFESGELKALLIKRDKEPENDRWSLPGAYVQTTEVLKNAARRVLNELTGIHDVYLTQVGIFDAVDRYPNHRIISVLYCALVKPEQFDLLAGSHAKEVKWETINKHPDLPFDHNLMLNSALDWLKEEIWRKPILANLLPEKFTLNQMMEVYQFILQSPIDNRNFRKKILNLDLLEKLMEKTSGGQQRPAYLYKWKAEL